MAELLKNLYSKKYINTLSSSLKKAYPNFKTDTFIDSIFDTNWQSRELKSRMRHISTILGRYLTDNYIANIEILKKTFSAMPSDSALENMIFQDYTELYGMDDFNTSMMALKHFTINSSSEFAIRRFIIKYPKETMQQMSVWTESQNEHVRRLATEGCRPRLPWTIALPLFKNNPQEVLAILELLKDDESQYVRKSVANNINDISKDNPALVIALTNRWIGKSKNRDSILKHGCRTLLKESNPEILKLFGYLKVNHLKLRNFEVQKKLKMGENLEFSFELDSSQNLGKLRVEFIMYFLRKNSRHNKKNFKLAEGIYKKKSKTFSKNYSFKPISTRVYYRGIQAISIVVNGEELIKKEFTLS